jgi:hypothetical protein
MQPAVQQATPRGVPEARPPLRSLEHSAAAAGAGSASRCRSAGQLAATASAKGPVQLAGVRHAGLVGDAGSTDSRAVAEHIQAAVDQATAMTGMLLTCHDELIHALCRVGVLDGPCVVAWRAGADQVEAAIRDLGPHIDGLLEQLTRSRG